MSTSLRAVSPIALLIGLAGCGQMARADCAGPITPGEAMLRVADGRIWYKITGTGRGTPVILLHGGPGYSSFYLKPFEALGDDRPVVRYDQLGGGKSDRITDTALFTIDHFVRELDSLRAHLGCQRVHLFMAERRKPMGGRRPTRGLASSGSSSENCAPTRGAAMLRACSITVPSFRAPACC
jgi:alpha/beta hydrolase fold